MAFDLERDLEVQEPIINSPFDEPKAFWYLREEHPPEKVEGRRPSVVFRPKEQNKEWDLSDGTLGVSQKFPAAFELRLVNLIRERLIEWRKQGYPGSTRTTFELLQYWRREGRQRRLFFAQVEAAEAVIFLKEARKDLLQGINIPAEVLPEGVAASGYKPFSRVACKMATGSGKSTVMGMLAAWSILNRVTSREEGRYSDVVLIVCPNVTIRDRLRELLPSEGEASLYRTRDLVPARLMPQLNQGKVIITNWHIFQLQGVQSSSESARVVKAGVPVTTVETVTIGRKNEKARGQRYMTDVTYQNLVATGTIRTLSEEKDGEGNVIKARIERIDYVESDAAQVTRILRAAGGKQNILVLNDEAHHAYRIHREQDDEEDGEEDEDDFYREAAIWIEGLDRIHKKRGINMCVDFSATPYFLGRVGKDTGRPFPWVISDFSLTDAIESGLVKIPQMAMRDVGGRERADYFNLWDWIMGKLTPSERGAKRSSPKPEAILKYAHTPIMMLGGLYAETFEEWKKRDRNGRPPVFIIVCKTTQIAKVVYEWIAQDLRPPGIAPAQLPLFRNKNDEVNTIRVDTKVINEVDTGAAKEDEKRWMRFTLDTVGRTSWPIDSQSRPIFPEGFEELATKLGRPLSPPGARVRCIISVGMLTEGWDCNTVTHIVGLRPFMSQLLCEQVVGRGLRRASYELTDDGKFSEELAKVFGIPFEVVPFKASAEGPAPQENRSRIWAQPGKERFEIRFPRVDGYTQVVRKRVTVDWESIPKTTIRPDKIPSHVEMKGIAYNNSGRLTLSGPGRIDDATLNKFRESKRDNEVPWTLATEIVRHFQGTIPATALFPQVLSITQRYLAEFVEAPPPGDKKDLLLSPYFDWVIETIRHAIRPDVSDGESPERALYEKNRDEGTTSDVDFWTSRTVFPVNKSHLNAIVADTDQWEQSAAYYIDKHAAVDAFVKNSGLGFTIPYIHNGQDHDYEPDFIIRFKNSPNFHLILETKGFDEKEEVKKAAAVRWVNAVNAEGNKGQWAYVLVKRVSDIPRELDMFAKKAA